MEKKESAYKRIRKSIKPENKAIIDRNIALSQQVRHILANHKSIRTQRALAEALGKEESEISRWLSGLHNLTSESITKMEIVLGERIVLTDLEAREKYAADAYQFFRHLQEVILTSSLTISGNLPTIRTIQFLKEFKKQQRKGFKNFQQAVSTTYKPVDIADGHYVSQFPGFLQSDLSTEEHLSVLTDKRQPIQPNYYEVA